MSLLPPPPSDLAPLLRRKAVLWTGDERRRMWRWLTCEPQLHPLKRYALSVLGPNAPRLGADAIQDFLRDLPDGALRHFEPRAGTFDGYLCRILRNTCIHLLFRESLEHRKLEFLARFRGGGRSVESSVVDQLAAFEIPPRLAELLNRLTLRQAMVVTLHYLDGLRLPEVARLLETSPNNVFQLKFQALRKLKRFADKTWLEAIQSHRV